MNSNVFEIGIVKSKFNNNDTSILIFVVYIPLYILLSEMSSVCEWFATLGY